MLQEVAVTTLTDLNVLYFLFLEKSKKKVVKFCNFQVVSILFSSSVSFTEGLESFLVKFCNFQFVSILFSSSISFVLKVFRFFLKAVLFTALTSLIGSSSHQLSWSNFLVLLQLKSIGSSFLRDLNSYSYYYFFIRSWSSGTNGVGTENC